jgi:hypothetical protein
MDEQSDRRALLLLALGAFAGLCLAGWGIARSGEARGALPPGAIAAVNGQPISAEAFERFAAAVADERRRGPLVGEDRRHLLERMVDEELLLQRGLDLGLARYEPTARRSIVSALIATLTADAEAREPSEAELREHWKEARERFTRPGRLTVEAGFVSVRARSEAQARDNADEIARRVRAGEPMASAAAELGDAPTAPLPGGPLPVETLRQYLGPTAALAAERLAVGEVGDPIRGIGGFHVLRLLASTPGAVAPYAEIRDQVRASYMRSLGERALADTIEDLREGSAILVDEARLAGE